MASFKRLGLILMTTCAGAALSACDGALSVASPGEGVIVVPAPAPTSTSTPTPATPTPTPGTPAAACPTGYTDVGVIGSFRGCRLPSLITGNTTLAKLPGVAYEINGRVDVGIDLGGAGTAPGGQSAILTIAPGVVLYANTTNADNDFMIVNRGSRILAEGTEALPIIFTSQQNIAGTATDDSQGQWGGVILAGRAPISNCNLSGVTGGSATCENVVEGTGTALYGGNAPSDNSGTFRYVQIRYSGTVLAEGVELQGLTLGGTGYGTTIDHVQVHNSSDDGIEIFGGRTNMKNLVMTGADDDSLDYDVGYRGLIQFVLAVQKPNNTQTDNYMIEVDTNGGEDALPRTWGQIANFTFIQTTSATNAALRIRGGADNRLVNGIIVTPNACTNIVAGASDASGKTTIRAADSTPSTTLPTPGTAETLGALQDFGPPMFNSIYFACGATKYAESTVNTIKVTAAEQQAIVEAAANNVTINGTSTEAVTGGYLRGTGAAAVTAVNPAIYNPQPASGLAAFFVTTTFLGAIGPDSTANDFDTWYQTWTCNSNRANFGTTSGSCTAVPN
ncbi:hypothetical protein [Sphingomonas hengshuiensis]|uniref:Lipoprotein n=1 Tax=Sphingomonas hengshuiensis TaxID=1609977 RepID=A0A7U4J8T7_9SPHN|nr:hypothetical protein [Sphingomonas hengshuiensis]AJP72308.1 hypothetical protein TS85_11700 [Sphingomonas hengshuiensis]